MTVLPWRSLSLQYLAMFVLCRVSTVTASRNPWSTVEPALPSSHSHGRLPPYYCHCCCYCPLNSDNWPVAEPEQWHISDTTVRWPSVLDFPGQSFISGSCPGFHGVLDLSWIWSLLTLHWKMCIFHSTTYSTLDFWLQWLNESFQSLSKANDFAVITVVKIPGSAHLWPTVAQQRQRILLTSLLSGRSNLRTV